MEKRFKSGYRGKFEFTVTGYGERRFNIRDFAQDDAGWNTGVFEGEVKPLVGCLWNGSYSHMEEYVPEEVAALFPGYVRARFHFDPFWIEYDGEAPTLVMTQFNGYSTEAILRQREADETAY